MFIADASTNAGRSASQTDATSSANTDSSTNTYYSTNAPDITNTYYSTNTAYSTNIDSTTNTDNSTNTAYITSTDADTNTVSGTNAAYNTDTASTRISGMLSSDGTQSTRIYTTDLNTNLLEFSNTTVPVISTEFVTESSLSSVEVSSIKQTKGTFENSKRHLCFYFSEICLNRTPNNRKYCRNQNKKSSNIIHLC